MVPTTTTTAGEALHSDLGVPSGRMGMWWFLCSEIAVFGGLIVCYVLFRLRHPEWAEPASHTWFEVGLINTLVLLTSSLTAVLAHAAVERKDHAAAARFLLITSGLAVVFLGLKAMEWTREISHGYVPAESLFWSFYYLMSGLHALHVVAGLVAILALWTAVRRGQHLQRVEVVGMYWHFVDVVWIFLLPLLYIAR